MIADVTLGSCTFVGYEGKDKEDIKNIIAKKQGLTDYSAHLKVAGSIVPVSHQLEVV